MADGPQITPLPYLDPENLAALQRFGTLTGGKPITDFTIPQQRDLVDEFQSPVPTNANIDVSTFDVSTSHGKVKTFLYKTKHAKGDLPVIYHLHGGGWIIGNAKEYTAFNFDLVERTQFALVFPEYSLAPEKQYPVQQEQCLEVLQYVIQHGKEKGLKTDKVLVSGDSAGGQLACAISILSHQRNLNLPIAHQILWHPVTNITSLIATFSQWTFQDGPFVSTAWAEQWIPAYTPAPVDRATILASPALLTPAQAKQFLPPSTVVVAQADWLRDQGEDFAKLLQTAGVPCGVIENIASLHVSEVLKGARDGPTARLAVAAVAETIMEVLGGR